MDTVSHRGKPLLDADDDALMHPPRPEEFLYGIYAVSKAAAEKLVVAVDPARMRTIIIRPCGMCVWLPVPGSCRCSAKARATLVLGMGSMIRTISRILSTRRDQGSFFCGLGRTSSY
jgi:hypothetical protein